MNWSYPGAEMRDVRARANDMSYRVAIRRPQGPAPDGGFPALVLLDAAACFGTCVEALARMARRPDATGVGQAVIIGIAHADSLYDAQRRQRDYTTAKADSPDAGGAAAFLSFITGELLPDIQAGFDIAPRRQALFGHSLAGYFALWALARQPDSFCACAAASPSLWWDPQTLTAALLAAPIRHKHIHMCMGEWEDALPPWQRNAPDAHKALARRQARAMTEKARTLAAKLSPHLDPGHLQLDILADEDHASIVSAAIPRALRTLFRADGQRYNGPPVTPP